MSTNGVEPTPIYDNIGKIPDKERSAYTPDAKVVAATVGAGVGAAVSTVTIWILETATAIDIPTEVENASVILFTAALTFVAGYFKKN